MLTPAKSGGMAGPRVFVSMVKVTGACANAPHASNALAKIRPEIFTNLN